MPLQKAKKRLVRLQRSVSRKLEALKARMGLSKKAIEQADTDYRDWSFRCRA